MSIDARRFDAEVLDERGTSLGEARCWGAAERSEDGASWRGWLRITDLGTLELPPGRYRLRSIGGWEAEFEPLVTRASRVFETDLLPIVGVGDSPWPDDEPPPTPRWMGFADAPPRAADDRGRYDPPIVHELRARTVSGPLEPLDDESQPG